MNKNAGAMLFALAFLVLVFLGSVNAGMTVEETTVTARVPMASVLFSLSSAAVLLLPLAVCLMGIALISMTKKRSAPAMLFAMLVSGGAAVGLEFIAYRPLRKRNARSLTFLITAIGMSFVLQQFVLFILPKLIPGYGGPNAQQPMSIATLREAVSA